MATKLRNQPIVFIVGPTASGKTALAIEVAEKVCGEIIAADSRTVYTGMDIGTAKPSAEELARVPHWGIDLREPGEPFSASDFKTYALQKIDEIQGRGHVPIVVGGTGLYVDSLVFDYQFGESVDPTLRAELEHMTIDELQEYCEKNNIELPENDRNKRYLIRSIEQRGSNNNRQSTPVKESIIVGIATDRDVLRERIEQRIEHLLQQGVVEEAKRLGEIYGWNSEAMTGNFYPLIHDYLEEKLTLDELKEKATTADWRLAKRQLTWLKRNQFIQWMDLDEAQKYLLEQLA